MSQVAAPGASVLLPEPTLGRWIGFRADTVDGRLGIVVGELRHGRCGRPASLVVRRGMFCERCTLVPLTQIERVFPDEQRILLRAEFSAAAVDEVPCGPVQRPPTHAGSHR